MLHLPPAAAFWSVKLERSGGVMSASKDRETHPVFAGSVGCIMVLAMIAEQAVESKMAAAVTGDSRCLVGSMERR